jgi:Rps23 Pro-64 3,4-dihydroxylase Tpa1-like proline 4-hydroxylase
VNPVNLDNVRRAFAQWATQGPFDHVVITDFFHADVATSLAAEFPATTSELYNGQYENALEIKKTCNIWDRFPPNTYSVLNYLNSTAFVSLIAELTGCQNLYSDPGLHGGGWHAHPPGGKLNVHKDYSLHPKTGLQRKFNLLVYLNPDYETGWGGELGLWSNGPDNQPDSLARVIEPKFNQAVIFDTTQDSWHGLEIPNRFPSGQDRKSLALYYLTDPPQFVDQRQRALFAPSADQKNDSAVLELIQRRSQTQGHDPQKWSRG